MAEEQERDGALLWMLSDEMLLAVLENLTAKWDRQSWCMVCKKFRDLEAASRKCIQLMKAEILEPVLRRYHHVERLSFSSCLEVKDVCLATVAKFTSQQLLSITVNGVMGFGVVGVRSLVECTSLQVVDMSFCKQVTDKEVILLSELQHLQELQLNGCHCVTDMGLSSVSRCKELKTLGLSWCSIGDVGIQNVVTGCLQLRNINLSRTKVSDKGLAFLALSRNLECLVLEACRNVTDKGLELLKSGCATLQKLNVSWCSNISSHGLAALTERLEQLQELKLLSCKLTSNMLFRSLQKLKMLQVIKLNYCSLYKADLRLVGKGCGDLKELSLSNCEGVVDFGVVGVVTAHTGLQRLNLSYCHISDVTLEAIATNCKGLLSLNMQNCSLVTAKGLVSIEKFCLSLEDLDLTHSMLNDDGLKSIARCTKLTFLTIGNCMDITNAGLVHIGATCKNLLRFDCSRSMGVGDEGIIAMASGCKRLKIVSVSYCGSVTDASMQSLASLKDLKWLRLRACKQVTSIGVCHIAASCKHLQELDVKYCNFVGDTGILAISHGCQDLQKISISHTAVTDVGMMAVASMPYLQDMDLSHMKVSIDCLAKAILTCGSLRYLKLPSELRLALPSEVILQLEDRGTHMRWLDDLI